jgi:hypothetical protein
MVYAKCVDNFYIVTNLSHSLSLNYSEFPNSCFMLHNPFNYLNLDLPDYLDFLIFNIMAIL